MPSAVSGTGRAAAPTLQSAGDIPAVRGEDDHAQHDQRMAAKFVEDWDHIRCEGGNRLLYLQFLLQLSHLREVCLFCSSAGFLELFALKLVVTSL